MVSSVTLFLSVLTLALYMLTGLALKRFKLISNDFGASISKYLLYIAQIAMLICGYIRPYDNAVTMGIIEMFFIAILAHVGGYLIASVIFRKSPEKIRDMLVFGTMFSNAGYMGIPVISAVFGSEYVIYATIYIGVFNLFSFSLGRLIYTHDKKYISVKGMFVNPGVIPVLIGFLVYFTGFGGWISETILLDNWAGKLTGIIYDAMQTVTECVAPLSMAVIGVGLADLDFKKMLRDRYVYLQAAVRLFLVPAVLWCVLRPLYIYGIIDISVYMTSVVLASTPTAAATTIFAELYGRDTVYSSELVSFTTILSAVTIPLVSLLFSL